MDCLVTRLLDNKIVLKLSALREVSLAHEMNDAGAPGLGWLYLGKLAFPFLRAIGIDKVKMSGLYIHSCQKMRYKGEYHPSYLADPVRFLFRYCQGSDCIPSGNL